MSEQVVDEQGAAKPKHLTVTVHNEDAGGEPIKIEGEPKTKIETIIHRMYKDLDTERKEGALRKNTGNLLSGFYTAAVDEVRANFAQWPRRRRVGEEGSKDDQ